MTRRADPDAPTTERGVIILREAGNRPAVRYTWPDGRVEVRYESGGYVTGTPRSTGGLMKRASARQAATFRPLK